MVFWNVWSETGLIGFEKEIKNETCSNLSHNTYYPRPLRFRRLLVRRRLEEGALLDCCGRVDGDGNILKNERGIDMSENTANAYETRIEKLSLANLAGGRLEKLFEREYPKLIKALPLGAKGSIEIKIVFEKGNGQAVDITSSLVPKYPKAARGSLAEFTPDGDLLVKVEPENGELEFVEALQDTADQVLGEGAVKLERVK